MNGLGDILLAASGHPIDHVANELTGELAGSKVRYQSAETESAFAKARKERADASAAETKNTTLAGLGDYLAAHASGSPEDRARGAAEIMLGGGAPDGAFAGINAFDTGNRDSRIADPGTSVADTQRLLLATGKPLADVFAPVGADMHYNKFKGTDPVLNPNTASKGAKLDAETGLITHRDQHPEDFRNAQIGSQPLDPTDVADVTRAQANGLLPYTLPRTYMVPSMYHTLAETIRKAPNGGSAADFHNMQTTTDSYDKGWQSQGIASYNSTVGHLNDFAEAALQLGNGNAQPMNAFKIAIAKATGAPEPTNLNETGNLLASELEGTYVKNGGTEAGRTKIAEAFKDVNSPDQFAGAIKTAKGLLAERAGALEHGFYAGRGLGDFRTRYLTPQGRSVLAEALPNPERPWYEAGQTAAAASEVHAQGTAGGASASARTPGAVSPALATSANPHPVGGNSASGTGGAGTSAVPEFANEAAALAAETAGTLKKGTRVKIGGQTGLWH